MKKSLLVDSHCQLDFPDFEDELDDVVGRAEAAGVGWMVTICTHVTRFDAVLALAEAHERVFCTVGIHPHEAGAEPEVSAEHLVRMARHPKVVGFGESGLDYHYDHSPREAQRRSFRVHAAAARQVGLPLVVHSRAADDDTLAILAEETAKGSFPGLIHCFSTSRALATGAVDKALGWIDRIKPRRAVLTHLGTGLDYGALAARLPPGVEPAYDGLVIESDAC